jgi:hypothetical protein
LSGKSLDRVIQEEKCFFEDPGEGDDPDEELGLRPSPLDLAVILLLETSAKQSAHGVDGDALAEIRKALKSGLAHRHRADPNKGTRRITPDDLIWKEGFLDKYFGQADDRA